MSVFKALTTATLMLTAQTLLEVSSAPVVLVTPETESSPAMVMKTFITYRIAPFSLLAHLSLCPGHSASLVVEPGKNYTYSRT